MCPPGITNGAWALVSTQYHDMIVIALETQCRKESANIVAYPAVAPEN